MGTYIQQQRIAAGYATQKSFADAIGKDQSWVSRLERGVAKELPPPEDLELVSSSLGLRLEDLLIAAGYQLGGPRSPDSPAVATIRAILESEDLTEEELRLLTMHIRSAVQMLKGKF